MEDKFISVLSLTSQHFRPPPPHIHVHALLSYLYDLLILLIRCYVVNDFTAGMTYCG